MKTMNCPRCAGTGFFYHYGVCFRCEGRKTVSYIAPRKEKPADPNTMPSFCLRVKGTDGKWWGAESSNDRAFLESRLPLYPHREKSVVENELKARLLANLEGRHSSVA